MMVFLIKLKRSMVQGLVSSLSSKFCGRFLGGDPRLSPTHAREEKVNLFQGHNNIV